jgi:hypothetical protein
MIKFCPSRVFFDCGRSVDWLYPMMMVELKKRFGSSATYVCAPNRISEFKNHCDGDDKVISIEDFDPLYLGFDSEDLIIADELKQAAKFEAKYGLSYFRDIAQQDRGLAANWLNIAPNAPGSITKKINLNKIICDINECFRRHEKFFTENKIDVIICRPSDISTVVLCEVARLFKIPVTFFHGSYYGLGAQWAAGPYMGDSVVHATMKENSLKSIKIPKDKSKSVQWKKPARDTAFLMVKRILKLCFFYIEFLIIDLKKGKINNGRVSFFQNVGSEFKRYLTSRIIQRVASHDVDEYTKKPFVYFPLPHEPEYTIQSMCKEFSDVLACIKLVSLGLPVGINLVLKEHQRPGNRSKDFYMALESIPNAFLAPSDVNADLLISRCEAVISMGGSTPAEAIKLGKRALVFGNRNPYNALKSIMFVDNPRYVQEAISRLLKPRKSYEVEETKREAEKFMKAMKVLSFDAIGTPLYLGGTRKRIPKKEVVKSVDLMLQVVTLQLLKMSPKRNA